MTGRLKRVLASFRYMPVREWPRFMARKRGHGRGETAFHVRGLPHPLIARAGTTDALALEYVFGPASHLPRGALPADATILDLGANAGYAAAHFAALYPTARVIALELDADNAALARRNLAPYANAELVEAGIWVSDGETTYGGAREDAFSIGKGEKVARTVTVETLLGARGIARADYVKMDIEGAEWPLFQQPGWLARVDAISLEVHDPTWIEPIETILRKAGFATSRPPDHWSSIYARRLEAKPATTPILGVPVSRVDLAAAAETILGWADAGEARLVCVRDVHGVMRAQDDPALMALHGEAGMVVPDGMPLVWLARRRGFKEVGRVSGADLVEDVCRRSVGRGVRHYFYGGKPGVAARLAETLAARFPGLAIAGASTPPFRALTPEEDAADVAAIAAARPQVVWVGLSTPKQELWMRDHVGRIPGATLIGCGAAFDFVTGEVRRAPRWMQRSGLEWAHRLASEPRRLWRRYLVLAPRFVWRVAREERRR